ncbi:MAG: glycosyltransferase family 4 protein [Flavobacteriales bacterium]|nr:glycosyltransferase family 4 protein [Flavobacteriales bacterium]
MEKPRVLILGKLPPPLMGPAIATRVILDSDLNLDFELHHFDTRINTDVADMGRFKWSKIKTIRALYASFEKTMIAKKPELVLIPIGQTTAGFMKDVPFIKSASKAGAKVIVQLRGSEFRTWFDGLDGIRKSMVRSALSRVEGVIVLGDNLRHLFEGLVPKEKIFVVSNGADYRFPERKNKTLRLLYLANYLPGKGIKELLQALIILSDKAEVDFEFHAYGSWDSDEYKEECFTLVSGKPNLLLNGSVSGEEKWQALADADVFIFAPNAPEGHPWSLVEASAAGLPIVSTDRGAIRQNVIDGLNGFLLENPDPQKLANRIQMMISDGSLRLKMAEASRNLYEKNFTAKAMSDQLRKVFQKVLAVECVE